MVELSKMELCGGGKQSSTESTTSCSECNKNKGKPYWSGSKVEYNCKAPFNKIGSDEDAGTAPEGKYPCSSPKSIKDKSALNNKPCKVVCEEKINDKCYKTTWVLKGCTYKGKKEDVKKQDTSKEAVPYILEDDWEKDKGKASVTDESIRTELVDYIEFAWDKANNCRGISAGRSIPKYSSNVAGRSMVCTRLPARLPATLLRGSQIKSGVCETSS